MRLNILRFITFILLIFTRRIKTKHSVFLLNQFFIGKNCNIELNNAYISHLNIHIEGKHNKLIMRGGYYLRGEIKIYGEGNTIEIGENGYLSNLRIVVRGHNCRVTIGNTVTSGGGFIACMGKNNYVSIGDDCMLAEHIDIWATDSHGIYHINEGTLLNTSAPIILCKHVWIGKWASVLKGVTIGDGAIIGMKAVVTKDIPPHSINVGFPTQTIKDRVYWKREFINE